MNCLTEGRYLLVSPDDNNTEVNHPTGTFVDSYKYNLGFNSTLLQTNLNYIVKYFYIGSGRIANVKTTTEYYPWMVYIERNNILESSACIQAIQPMSCTGSIISNKMYEIYILI